MLCVSIVEASVEAARRAIDEARRAGAFVELRIDALDSEIRRDPEAIASLVRGRPAILTHRRPADGGLSESAETDRLHTLASAAKQSGAWCDIELDSAEAIDRLELDRSRVLVSHHDTESTPEDLARVVDRLLAVPVAMAKIATMAVRTSDQFAHVEQLERARTAGRSLVAIAMGEKGTATRILGPAWGAPFTFCAVTSGRESAAGQVPLSLMRDRYRADRLTRQSFVIGLIAGRTTYSRSPAMHNRVLAETSTNGVYLPFAVDDLQEFLAATVRPATRRVPWTIRGFSVTNPHKTRAAELVDELDPLPGAVKTRLIAWDWGWRDEWAPSIPSSSGTTAGSRVSTPMSKEQWDRSRRPSAVWSALGSASSARVAQREPSLQDLPSEEHARRSSHENCHAPARLLERSEPMRANSVRSGVLNWTYS